MQGQNRCVDGEILWFDGCPAHERAKALVLGGARQGLADVSNRRTEVPDERGRTPGLLSRVSTVPPDPPARCGLPDPGTANLVWQVVTAIRVWEQAKNYGEPERFMGPERAARFRAAYERATGHQSVRPEDSGS